VPVTPATELYLKEIFSSLQGEGTFIGRRQLFVRLARCNLACAYCDTDYSDAPIWRAETGPGESGEHTYPNPVSPEFLTGLIQSWQSLSTFHHSLALTGGEPLVQSRALAVWLPAVSPILPVYLETNGTLPKALKQLLPYLTWVSMDIKLAGISGSTTPWEDHAAFIDSGRQKICQIKVVIDEHTMEAELVEVARFVHQHAPEIPLIMQPRTVAGQPALSGQRLLSLQTLAACIHDVTLVIPQMHPFLSVR
jgi:organic radical activating enzyme